MKYWGCTECHHEWEGTDSKCDWCGGKGKVLEESTPFSRMVNDLSGLLGLFPNASKMTVEQKKKPLVCKCGYSPCHPEEHAGWKPD